MRSCTERARSSTTCIVYRARRRALPARRATPSNREGLRLGLAQRRRRALRVRRPHRRHRADRAPGAEGARRARGRGAADRVDRAAVLRASRRRAVLGTSRAPSRAPATPARTASRSSSRRGRGAAMWSALLEAGKPLGVEPAGLGARDTLRLEARLCALRQRHRRDDDPARGGPRLDRQAGEGRLRRPRRARAAEGARACRASSSASRSTGRGIARHGYPLTTADGAPASSPRARRSPTVGKAIGLALRADRGRPQPGTEFAVDCRGHAAAAPRRHDPRSTSALARRCQE